MLVRGVLLRLQGGFKGGEREKNEINERNERNERK